MSCLRSLGGLVVRVLGIQGFLPASHVCDTSLLQPPQQPLQHQQPVVVQVLHADVSRRRLLVSQRLPVSRTELMLRRLAPGDLVSGTIVDIHTFGCVVQVRQAEALHSRPGVQTPAREGDRAHRLQRTLQILRMQRHRKPFPWAFLSANGVKSAFVSLFKK